LLDLVWGGPATAGWDGGLPALGHRRAMTPSGWLGPVAAAAGGRRLRVPASRQGRWRRRAPAGADGALVDVLAG